VWQKPSLAELIVTTATLRDRRTIHLLGLTNRQVWPMLPLTAAANRPHNLSICDSQSRCKIADFNAFIFSSGTAWVDYQWLAIDLGHVVKLDYDCTFSTVAHIRQSVQQKSWKHRASLTLCISSKSASVGFD